MTQDFWRPSTGVSRQIEVAGRLGLEPLSLVDGLDPEKVLAWIRRVGEPLAKRVGENDFRKDRLVTKADRRAAGIFKNARWYNKRWRLLQAIERKIEALVWNQQKYEATRVSRGGSRKTAAGSASLAKRRVVTTV